MFEKLERKSCFESTVAASFWEVGTVSKLICLGMGMMIGRSTANFSDGSAGMRVCDGGKSGKCGSSFVGTCTQRKG